MIGHLPLPIKFLHSWLEQTNEIDEIKSKQFKIMALNRFRFRKLVIFDDLQGGLIAHATAWALTFVDRAYQCL